MFLNTSNYINWFIYEITDLPRFDQSLLLCISNHTIPNPVNLKFIINHHTPTKCKKQKQKQIKFLHKLGILRFSQNLYELPIFNTGTGLHHLQLSRNTPDTSRSNIIEIHQWGFTNQLNTKSQSNNTINKSNNKSITRNKVSNTKATKINKINIYWSLLQ